MKRVVFAGLLCLALSGLAFGGSYSYTVTGNFSGGTYSAGPNGNDTTDADASFTSGANTLKTEFKFDSSTSGTGFIPNGGTSNDNLGAFINTVTPSCPGASCAGVSPNGNFALTIHQSIPASGTATLSGSFTGTIWSDSSTGELLLSLSSPYSLSITTPDNITTIYRLTQVRTSGNGCTAANPCLDLGKGNGQLKTIDVEISQVPEPASIMLLGSGLTGLAGLVRRRLKK